ncbi:MAG: hypothetical protein OJJ54_09870 [Pseudonocardia sp.]|nr:hypothetical protein [Pseudonocardia sp.]
MPVIPQNALGMRIEPPVSVPMARGTWPSATAAPDPDDDPPVVRVGSHGLWVAPKVRFTAPPQANSNVPSLASSTPPASASRAASAASSAGT